ncbi:MAG TPA: glycosyltransferase family 1 protein [Deltaproteobacteria bacterium]|nr:MAG: hypothetical protein DRG59_10645 [Deltaproteobacteria bacterium]HDM75452.1 glycosyltransferase family 1 protein [Deltaproteobacteria bacterium]
MRVIIDFTPVYYGGGIGVYALNLVRSLVRLNGDLELKLISFFPGYSRKGIADRYGLSLKHFPLPLTPLLYAGMSTGAPLLDFFEGSGQIFHATMGLSLPTRKRVVLTIHDLTFVKYPQWVPHFIRVFYKRAVPYSLSNSGRIIVPSASTRSDLIEIFNVPSGKIRVIPLSSNFEDLHDTAKSERKSLPVPGLSCNDYFIYIGALERRKNILNMLRAFIRFSEKFKGIKMFLVGSSKFDPSYSSKVLNFIRSFGKGNIIYREPLDREEIYVMLKNARALVLLSHYEGFGLPVVEAMKLGVPVLASREGSLPEICGDACLFADKDHVEDISEKLELLMDEGLRRSLSEKGRERGKKYSWQKTARMTLDVYRELLELPEWPAG